MRPCMEWIGSFLLGILVFSCVLQLFWAHALSAIARKTGQNDLMQMIAWIPLLQLAPMLAAGGGSVLRFLAAMVALAIGNGVLLVVAAFLGDAFGSGLAALGIGVSALIAVGYFGGLFWRMAVARELSGWVGLLLFVPIVNFFVYPYIAFHDGWVGPHKIGLLFGLIITLASSAPSFLLVGALSSGEGLPPELATLMQQPGLGSLENLDELIAAMPTDSPAGDPDQPAGVPSHLPSEVGRDHAASLRALFALQNRFQQLEQIATPRQLGSEAGRTQTLELIRTTRAELEAYRGVLDNASFEQLATHLLEIEARLHDPSKTAALAPHSAADARPTWSPRERRKSAPGPAAIASFSEDSAPPVRPFPVQADADCGVGTELRNQATDRGDEEWCQQLPERGGLRHGWYARYFADGRPESMGEYREGLRVGVWTRFHASGSVRAQAEFREGLQHGWMLSFDEAGARQKAVRFDAGTALR